MANTLSQTVAQAISDDRRGADYYKDSKVLADFLHGQFGSTHEAAEEAAKSIASDRNGADYYKNPEILADFLGGRFAADD